MHRSWFTSPANSHAYQYDGENLQVLVSPTSCDGFIWLVGTFEPGVARGKLHAFANDASLPIGTFEASVVE